MECEDGRMILDAVVSVGSDGRTPRRSAAWGRARPGSLVTVIAELPSSQWGLAARTTLERWVGEGREIELRLRRRPRLVQVELVGDEASMILDLAG